MTFNILVKKVISRIYATSSGLNGAIHANRSHLSHYLRRFWVVSSVLRRIVVQSNGQIVPRRSLCHLRMDEPNNNVAEERKRQVLMECLRAKLGDSISLSSEPLIQ